MNHFVVLLFLDLIHFIITQDRFYADYNTRGAEYLFYNSSNHLILKSYILDTGVLGCTNLYTLRDLVNIRVHYEPPDLEPFDTAFVNPYFSYRISMICGTPDCNSECVRWNEELTNWNAFGDYEEGAPLEFPLPEYTTNETGIAKVVGGLNYIHVSEDEFAMYVYLNSDCNGALVHVNIMRWRGDGFEEDLDSTNNLFRCLRGKHKDDAGEMSWFRVEGLIMEGEFYDYNTSWYGNQTNCLNRENVVEFRKFSWQDDDFFVIEEDSSTHCMYIRYYMGPMRVICNGREQWEDEVCGGDDGVCVMHTYNLQFQNNKCVCKDSISSDQDSDCGGGKRGWFDEFLGNAKEFILDNGTYMLIGGVMFVVCCGPCILVLCFFCTIAVVVVLMACCIVCCGGVLASLGCNCCCVIFGVKTVKKKKKLKQFNHLASILEEEEADGEGPKFEINKELFKIEVDSLKLIKQLGKGGGGGTVFLAEWNRQKVGYKVFRTRDLDDTHNFGEFEREVKVMGSISHPNVLRFYGCTLNFPRIGIVMEYCKHGDLQTFMFKNKNQPFDQKIKFAVGICEGMFYLHERDIVHRDLKSQNVLITKSLVPKLIDFGLSRVLRSGVDNKVTKLVGTAFYMAPEVTLGKDYNNLCDVFSFSIVLFEIMQENFFPYGRGLNFNVEIKVATDPNFRPKVDQSLVNSENKFVYDIMKAGWKQEANQRPEFARILKILREDRSNQPTTIVENATTVQSSSGNSNEDDSDDNRENENEENNNENYEGSESSENESSNSESSDNESSNGESSDNSEIEN